VGGEGSGGESGEELELALTAFQSSLRWTRVFKEGFIKKVRYRNKKSLT